MASFVGIQVRATRPRVRGPQMRVILRRSSRALWKFRIELE